MSFIEKISKNEYQIENKQNSFMSNLKTAITGTSGIVLFFASVYTLKHELNASIETSLMSPKVLEIISEASPKEQILYNSTIFENPNEANEKIILMSNSIKKDISFDLEYGFHFHDQVSSILKGDSLKHFSEKDVEIMKKYIFANNNGGTIVEMKLYGDASKEILERYNTNKEFNIRDIKTYISDFTKSTFSRQVDSFNIYTLKNPEKIECSNKSKITIFNIVDTLKKQETLIELHEKEFNGSKNSTLLKELELKIDLSEEILDGLYLSLYNNLKTDKLFQNMDSKPILNHPSIKIEDLIKKYPEIIGEYESLESDKIIFNNFSDI